MAHALPQPIARNVVNDFMSGPKKPKPTFGDVMLGIPAGRGGEREERKDKKGGGGHDRGGQRRDRGGEGGERKGREDRGGGNRGPRNEHGQQHAKSQQHGGGENKGVPKFEQKLEGDAGQGEAAAAPPPAPKKSAPKGPMVVIRKAAGTIETRTLSDAPSTPAVAAAPAPAAAAEAEKTVAAPPPSAPTMTVTKAPKPVGPSVYEEVAETESFSEMFEASAKTEGGMPNKRGPKVGDKVKVKIFQLGADTAFVSLGGKSEAMIELNELKDEEGILRSGVGDEVEAYVVETGAKGTILSRKLPKGAASMSLMQEAQRSGMPVEGLVLAVNKGGLEVAVGEVRAFCPASQVEMRFVGKLDEYVGMKLTFKVTQAKGSKVVLSRRAVLEDEQKAKAEETRKTLEVGKVVTGPVTNVREFGAFVDLGGLEGMIPLAELSHLRVTNAGDVVRIGDVVEVEVLRIEAPQPNSPDKAKHKERITLSMRARQEDPWKAALEEFKEGVRLKGKVVRLQPFGAFVELKPGIDGLIHVSAMSDRRIAHPKDVLKVGEEVEVQVEKVDAGEKKVGLRLVKDGQLVGHAAPAGAASSESAHAGATASEPKAHVPRPKVGTIVTGKVDRIESFGVFVSFPGGKGLIPASETGTERGTDLRKTFSMGQELKAEIIEIERGDKLRLSMTAAIRSEERAEMNEWKKSQKSGGGGKGFGTLADKFKGLTLK